MVSSEIQQLMHFAATQKMDVNQRIAFFSERGKGTPYVLFCLGEGPTAKYDRDPLIDFNRVDCMTFCEQILALSISRDYPEMFNNLQRIRYRNGAIDMLTRNHYTISDWLPANAWLLSDATKTIGGTLCAAMTKTIDRKAFFITTGIAESDLQAALPPQTMTVDYVPNAHLLDVTGNLKGGEIVSIVTSRPGIISAHMGFIIRERGGLIFRHAASKPEVLKVVDEPYEQMVQTLRKSENRVGMIFMRIREDYQLPEMPDPHSTNDAGNGTHR